MHHLKQRAAALKLAQAAEGGISKLTLMQGAAETQQCVGSSTHASHSASKSACSARAAQVEPHHRGGRAGRHRRLEGQRSVRAVRRVARLHCDPGRRAALRPPHPPGAETPMLCWTS